VGTITRYYSTSAVPGTIGNPGGFGNTVITLWLASTPQNYPSQYPFILVIDGGTSSMEAVLVTSGLGTPANPWYVQRGWDGTLAVPHAQGAPVTHDSIGWDYATSRAHEAADNTSGTLPHNLPATAWLASSFATINETVTPNATVSVQTWASIPQTFAHLLVVVSGRASPTSSASVEVQATINGSTSTRYSYIGSQSYVTTGTTVNMNNQLGLSVAGFTRFIQICASQTGSAVNTGGGFAIFPNYTSTTYNKWFIALSGWGNGTDNNITQQFRTGFYNPTSQSGINSLSLALASGTFLTGTFFGLYGLG
jgi:hypothetical protein